MNYLKRKRLLEEQMSLLNEKSQSTEISEHSYDYSLAMSEISKEINKESVSMSVLFVVIVYLFLKIFKVMVELDNR